MSAGPESTLISERTNARVPHLVGRRDCALFVDLDTARDNLFEARTYWSQVSPTVDAVMLHLVRYQGQCGDLRVATQRKYYVISANIHIQDAHAIFL